MLEQEAAKLQAGSYRRQMTYTFRSRQLAPEGSPLRNAIGRADLQFLSLTSLGELVDDLLATTLEGLTNLRN